MAELLGQMEIQDTAAADCCPRWVLEKNDFLNLGGWESLRRPCRFRHQVCAKFGVNTCAWSGIMWNQNKSRLFMFQQDSSRTAATCMYSISQRSTKPSWRSQERLSHQPVNLPCSTGDAIAACALGASWTSWRWCRPKSLLDASTWPTEPGLLGSLGSSRAICTIYI